MKSPFDKPVPAVLRQAKWIWPDYPSADLHNSYVLFRKTFLLPVVPRRARLYITADQSYRLYVNGHYVARGPARGFQSHWPYDEVDVASLLRRGRNVIAVRAHNPGFSNFQYLCQMWAGLLVAAKWGSCVLLTDGSWKCRAQIGIARDTVKTSIQLFCQEHVDARIEPPAWTALDFEDTTWSAPKHQAVWNSPPWHNLEPRGIPLLRERPIEPVALIGIGEGKCADGYRQVRDVVRLRHSEDLCHAAISASPRRLLVPPTGPDRFRSYLIDFGRTVVGSLKLTVSGARGGEIVDSLHVEVIDSKNLKPCLIYPAECRMAFGYRLICRRGQTTHAFHHPFGFRYMILTLRDSRKTLKVEASLEGICYPLARKGSFVSSDRQLAKIWECCAWTQQCCSLDAYVDTPWREQAQWWGDARVQGWNTFYLGGDARLFRRGIHCIASQTTPNGLTYGHAPTAAHNCVMPDFTLIWILTLWDYYWQTGSLEAFETHRAVLENALAYFRDRTDMRYGLVSSDPRYWLFLDWADINRDGFPAILNLWLLLALEKAAEMYRLGGNNERADELQRWSMKLRRALRRLIDHDGLVRDGLALNGKFANGKSIHVQTLAIMADLNPLSEARIVKNMLLPFIREQIRPAVKPSAYWITYVFSVLAARSYGAEVVAYIGKHWSPMVPHGTTFEIFDPPPGVFSRSHAWSAHPLFHLMQIIGGITQTAAGWREVRFAPCFVGEHGGTAIPTPRGLIRSRWRRQGDEAHVSLSLPCGVSARILLPGCEMARVKGRNTWRSPIPADNNTAGLDKCRR